MSLQISLPTWASISRGCLQAVQPPDADLPLLLPVTTVLVGM